MAAVIANEHNNFFGVRVYQLHDTDLDTSLLVVLLVDTLGGD
jgi:hypothetical protein